jgi:hypothetical protein
MSQAYNPVSAEIFKWTGSDGIVHYSESAPESASGKISELDLASIQLTTVSFPGYKNALKVAQSLESSRLERDKLRNTKRELRKEKRAEKLYLIDQSQRTENRHNIFYPLSPSINHNFPHPIGQHSIHKHYPPHKFHEELVNQPRGNSPAVVTVKYR